ncbi:prephenate dehydratase [Puniceicoccaceae bacterium K14]|nr:prephenate dehydratase [Puniceicoccaceae bacterium K14]
MDLSSLRQKIDSIDEQVLKLLNERVRNAAEIGRIKREQGAQIYVASREEQVLKKLSSLNEGPLSEAAIRAIYREIMSAAIALEKPMAIAYLGPEATFTHQAATKKFGASIDYMAVPSIADVFHMVAKGEADYGVIPIENTTGGSVEDSMDMFIESDLKICAQIFLTITHNLISNSQLNEIERVYSKDQGILQCRNWLHAHLPNASLHKCESTAKAVEIAKGEEKVAAIASSLAADLYGVPMVSERIQDQSDNTTRFIVIGKESSGFIDKVKFKSSFLVSVNNEVGSLEKALAVFSKRGLNLSKIESRPSGKAVWEYSFFVDVEGHFEEESVATAIEELKSLCPFVKWLGSYPSAKQ